MANRKNSLYPFISPNHRNDNGRSKIFNDPLFLEYSYGRNDLAYSGINDL